MKGSEREQVHYSLLEMPWCELLLASGSNGLCLVQFGRSLREAQSFLAHRLGEVEWKESKSANRQALEQLRQYFAGTRKEFSLQLDLRGTLFQLRVWGALRKIPCGQTRTYGQVARAVGSPRAFRAVGATCGSNPVPIIVPCHRVVGGTGSLTGFGGGLSLKEKLLAHERLLARD